MKRAAKSTGWKIPLLFCGAVILLAVFIRILLPHGSPEPEFPPDLHELAKNLRIDLDNDKDGKAWKNRMVNAASGFISRDTKDRRLAAIIDDALSAEHFAAACAGTMLMENMTARRLSLAKIFEKAVDDCDTAPWAVFAIRGMGNVDEAIIMNKKLTEVWRECKKSG